MGPSRRCGVSPPPDATHSIRSRRRPLQPPASRDPTKSRIRAQHIAIVGVRAAADREHPGEDHVRDVRVPMRGSRLSSLFEKRRLYFLEHGERRRTVDSRRIALGNERPLRVDCASSLLHSGASQLGGKRPLHMRSQRVEARRKQPFVDAGAVGAIRPRTGQSSQE